MSSIGASDDFTIMRLRVKGSKLDPLAARTRVQLLISEIRLHPLLPESASLFIRKLEDPSPGLLRLEAIDSRATQAWRRSFNSRFRELATSAARPARGPVSSSAEAVVFLDYSELLACLTADWCNGFVGARWWWHSFLKRGDIEQIIRKVWKDKVEYVPAALEQLAKTNVLLEFVGALSERETCELIERVVERFALRELQGVVGSLRREVLRTAARVDFLELASPVAVREAEVRSVAPWKYVVPESDTPRLRPAQQLFLGVTLMIKRAPAQVRRESFARDVERWHLVVVSGLELEIKEKVTERSDPIDGPNAIQGEAQILRIETEWIAATEVIEERQVEIDDMGLSATLTSQAVSKPVDNRVMIVPEMLRAQAEWTEAGVVSELLVVQTGAVIETTLEVPAEVEEYLTIDTQLGGLFYLVNLAIFLEIYSDFTSPVETFTDLNIWDFVALAGSELNDHENSDDPIWSLLANLAGHEESFSRKGAKAQRKTRGSRRSELCALAPLREKSLIWLSHMMPYLRKRLRLALATDDFPTVLCRHRARVNVTATHVDVFFSLAELPIEIRLAGLDRDPGWVPAAGRFIAFHFE